MDCQAIYREACDAGELAWQCKEVDLKGEWFPCGFAWVLIKPARGPFITYLKSLGRRGGHKGYSGGWQIWQAGSEGYTGQAMYVKLAGARAFADVLKKHGIGAVADSRMD